MKVSLFYRKSFKYGNYSIEKVFNTIFPYLQGHLSINKKVIPFYTKGFFNRLVNSLYSFFNQGDINHITGDVHYLALFLNSNRTLITIHDLIIIHRNKGIKRFIYYYIWYYLPIKKAKYITVISNQIKKELLHYFPWSENKIKVIYNPNTLKLNKKNNSNLGSIFYKFNPVILHIGVTENKNIENTAISLKRIKCHFRIIGKLSNIQILFLNNLEISYSYVYNLSEDELFNEYNNADIVSFISTYEGFGLPIIEAQSMGKPCITSNCSSMPEIAGNGACIVNPYNINNIYNGFLKMINDDNYRNNIIIEGFQNIKKFDPFIISQQYIDLYKKIIKDNE